MDERENLPAKLAAQGLTASVEKRGSLVTRGMAAVLVNKQHALTRNNDALYRQAREVYNRLTDDGLGSWFGYKEREAPLTEALNIFLQLAAEGYGKAYYPLSTLYGGEQSINGDPAQSLHFLNLTTDWLLDHQHLDDPEIWCDLGAIYVGEDNEQAMFWFHKSAVAGFPAAMWHLCVGYENEEDWENALAWQSKAAIAGHEKAQRGLEHQHEHGDLESKIADRQVFNWYEWSAEQGHLWAQLSLGEYFCSVYSEDANLDLFHPADNLEIQEQIVRWLQKAAAQGNARGQWLLGDIYRTGHIVAQDYMQAEYWYRKAAEQGDSRYQNKLGQIYRTGLGISQDDRKAVYWFTKAAEQEHADGQFNLGFMYDKGRGVAQDDAQAVYWFRKAAEQDVPWAQVRLAIRYRNGVGVARDINLSKYWFLKAASNTATSARARLAQKHAKRSLENLDKFETNKETP